MARKTKGIKRTRRHKGGMFGCFGGRCSRRRNVAQEEAANAAAAAGVQADAAQARLLLEDLAQGGVGGVAAGVVHDPVDAAAEQAEAIKLLADLNAGREPNYAAARAAANTVRARAAAAAAEAVARNIEAEMADRQLENPGEWLSPAERTALTLTSLGRRRGNGVLTANELQAAELSRSARRVARRKR